MPGTKRVFDAIVIHDETHVLTVNGINTGSYQYFPPVNASYQNVVHPGFLHKVNNEEKKGRKMSRRKDYFFLVPVRDPSTPRMISRPIWLPMACAALFAADPMTSPAPDPAVF